MKKFVFLPMILVLVAANYAYSSEDSSQWALRFSGGYGFSLNSTVENFTVGSPNVYPLSSGIPTGVEALYSVNQNLGLGLGVFPEFMSQKFRMSNLAHTDDVEVTETATFLPVLFDIYLGQSLGRDLSLFIGVGTGVVPANTHNFSSVGGINSSNNLDAGLVFRAQLGLDWAMSRHVHLGLLIQELTFNQTNLNSGGYSYDYNQIAPMLYADLKI
jgi:hypothetical protein